MFNKWFNKGISRSRPPIVIIIMSEFKVGGTYICTTAHYRYVLPTYYKIFYSLTWRYNQDLQ